MTFTEENIGEIWISRDYKDILRIKEIIESDSYNTKLNVRANYEDGSAGLWDIHGLCDDVPNPADLLKRITPEDDPEYFL